MRGLPQRTEKLIAFAYGLLERSHPMTLQQLAPRAAYPFGPRKHRPYKIWLDECARQLGEKPQLVVGARKPDPRQDGLFG